jgi:hypothetical protein
MGLLLLFYLFATEAPYFFVSDRSATRDWCIKINIINENLMSFLAVFEIFHVRICKGTNLFSL